jgi:hypothetical protein
MPGHDGGFHPQIAQDRESGNGNRQQSRLRIFSELQLLVGTLEAKSGQREPQRFVGLLENTPRDGPRRGKGAAHSGGLGTLSGKNECDLHRGLF